MVCVKYILDPAPGVPKKSHISAAFTYENVCAADHCRCYGYFIAASFWSIILCSVSAHVIIFFGAVSQKTTSKLRWLRYGNMQESFILLSNKLHISAAFSICGWSWPLWKLWIFYAAPLCAAVSCSASAHTTIFWVQPCRKLLLNLHGWAVWTCNWTHVWFIFS